MWTGLYLYDAGGRLKSVDNAATASGTEPQNYITSVWYNPRGQTTVITYGNGATESFFYNDQRGWLTRVLGKQGATTLMDQTYTRNAKGMITAIAAAEAGRSWTYAYDEMDRLVTADNGDGTAQDRIYRYDDADNMVFNSGLGCGSSDNLIYSAQGARSVRPHAPVTVCGTAVSYDANGNMLSYDAGGPGLEAGRAETLKDCAALMQRSFKDTQPFLIELVV